jgi:hypothetical protein
VKHLFSIVAAMLAGFIGGILSNRVNNTREEPRISQVFRARSFELVNEAGQAISYWGVDQGQNAILAFGSRGLALGGARPQNIPPGLQNPHNQLLTIGLQGNDSPLVQMNGANGKTRARLLLSSYGKPVLLMEDETGPRVLLGIEQSDTPGPEDDDWSLAFFPERARIGMYKEKVGGQTYVRGSFAIHTDKLKYPYEQPK